MGEPYRLSHPLIPVADGSDMMGSCRNPAALQISWFSANSGLIPENRIMKIDEQFPLLSTPGCLKRLGYMSIFIDAVCGRFNGPFSLIWMDPLEKRLSVRLSSQR